jgi:hypothetical protein
MSLLAEPSLLQLAGVLKIEEVAPEPMLVIRPLPT